ncbi:MAG: tetratricopeptide repeat protein [Elusimicrobia bacterium]|nr:tetratricopeptide repeat protein [Elusimicrobiota bacterium]
MKRLCLAALMVSICSVSAPARSDTRLEPLPEDLKVLAKNGLDSIYAVDIPAAEKYFGEALKKYPDHPIPYFGMAMSKWAELEYLEDESDPGLEKEYGELTDKALEVGRAWIKKHPGDANAYLVLGGMYGLRARLGVLQHHWVDAFLTGKKALSATRRSLKIDPELYDAYLGLGMYEYYSGTLSGVVKLLAAIVMRGDAKKGLEYLNLCREKGYFNALAAKLMLIEIYTTTGSPYKDPATAVKWARELRAQYPNHPQMHFVEIVSLFENKEYDESRKEALDYLKKVEGGVVPYRRRYLPRVLTAIATTYLVEGKYDEAAEYFRRAADTLKEDPKSHPARWGVWAIVRLGNVSDLKGLRDKAVEYYKQAQAYKDEWGFSESIEKYLKSPFSAAELPGQMPPP